VIEALGWSNIPSKMVYGIQRAIDKNIPVVMVSRCPKGRVLDTYGYDGGGKHLRELGVIFDKNLPEQKARIKLMLILGITNDLKIIKGIFENKLK
jgi:L-asparaginase